MSTRRVLALLVVLALSLGLCSIPASSAPLQRTSVTSDYMAAGPSCKDGDGGGDIDGGDDDRWGNTEPVGGNDDPESPGGDDDGTDDEVGSNRMFGRVSTLQIGVRTIFGILVMML